MAVPDADGAPKGERHMNDEILSGRRKLLGLGVLGLAATSLLSMALSLALFTDTAAVGANAFSAGTISISTSPASALLTLDPIMPGDTVNASLVVTNDGTGALRYAMTSASTNPDGLGLRDQLGLVVKTAGTNCATFDGVTLYSGTLADAAFGDVTPGDDANDRTLAGGMGETLCFRATLDISTGNAFQGATTTTTFMFTGEQTANN
jgi:hypothetical protein